MVETADAIVIGVGVIGAAVAFELARAGFRTLGVDRTASPGHGSTSGSSAIVRMHYSTLEGSALAWEARQHWGTWRDHLEAPAPEPLARFVECGCLVPTAAATGRLAVPMAHSRAIGCRFELWDRTAILARLPGLDLRGFGPPRRLEDPDFGEPTGEGPTGAVFWPEAGYVTDPALAAQNLAAAARRRGARFRMRATVAAVLVSGGRAGGVRLADGTELHAPVVINAAGPASGRINVLAGVLGGMRIRTRAIRQEVAHLPAPAGLDARGAGLILSDDDTGCYCRPEAGNALIVGSQNPACDPPEEVADDAAFDRSPGAQARLQALRLAQRIPALGIPNRLAGLAELYDVSDDWLPIYDRSDLPGFYMACGTSGNQFKTAPVAGRLMAEIVAACEGGHDHDAVPLRLRLPLTGQEIGAGTFSRRRAIDARSSFSVLG